MTTCTLSSLVQSAIFAWWFQPELYSGAPTPSSMYSTGAGPAFFCCEGTTSRMTSRFIAAE